MNKLLAGSAIVAFLAFLACLSYPAPSSLLADVPFGGMVLDARGEALRLSLADDDKYRLRITLEDIAPEVISATLAYEDKYFFSHPGVNVLALARGAASLISGRRQGGSTITMQVARLLGKLKTSHLWGKFQQIVFALALELRHSKEDILEAYFNLAPYGGNVEGIEAAARIYFHKAAANLTRQESEALALVPQNPVARNPVSGSDFWAARKRFHADAAPLKINSFASLPFAAPHLALELNVPGGVVPTTIESDLQLMVERRLRAFTGRYGRCGLTNGAALLLRATDMSVVALAGSADFRGHSIAGQIDGTRARRSPGSTLKPFIYALALDQGLIHPMTILPDSPKSFGGYDPENFDRGFQGPIPATRALQASRNLPAINLAERLAPPGLYGFLRQAQVQLAHGPEHYGLALVLGGAEVTMRELATLYATLANDGLWRPLRFRRDERPAAARRLMSPEAAWLTVEMLRREEAVLKSRAHEAHYFYKTGTSNGFRDAWTVGILGDYVLLVWVGNFDNTPNPHLVGATAALPLFGEMAQSLAHLRPLRERSPLPREDLKLVTTKICPATGDIFRGQCADAAPARLIAGVSPSRDTGIYRKVLVERDSGLRACAPEGSEMRWYENWPSDMRQIFAAAGIHKPEMPDWSPRCRKSMAYGKAPRILLPKRNVTYYRRLSDRAFSLPLQGAADGESKTLHWYCGRNYIGSTRPGETLKWAAPPGRWDLFLVDDAGRSAKLILEVVTLVD